MLLHEAMGRERAGHGVTHVFGVLGEANMYVADSFEHLGRGLYVAMTDEAASVMAAMGYAHTSGRLGVATVTQGPGLTNAITALVEVARSGIPVLVIAGDTTDLDYQNAQNVPQREIVAQTGARYVEMRAPETMPSDLARAIRLARADRCTVVLNMRGDFQMRDVGTVDPVANQVLGTQATPASATAMDEAAGVIASCARPIVLGGRGAADVTAREALVALADRLGAPLATTFLAKDLFRGHPHDLGIFGTLSHDVAAEQIARADCVIAFGASMNRYTTDSAALLKDKALVHIDIDARAIGAHVPATVGVVGDSASVARQIAELLDVAGVRPTGFASPDLGKRLAAYEFSYSDAGTKDAVDVRTAVRLLDERLPRERTVVRDCGRAMYGIFARLHVHEPAANIALIGFGAIGLGVGTAVGASFGAPERPTLLVVGDGGFRMSGLSEFNTAVRYGRDLVVVVMNDGAYGAEHVHFRRRGMDPSITVFAWPEFAALAQALGGTGLTARNEAELAKALDSLTANPGAVLIDVKLDPDAVPSGYA